MESIRKALRLFSIYRSSSSADKVTDCTRPEKTDQLLTGKDSEASCSSTRRESKRNPLKRKVDVSLEESELQSEERPEKSRRTETDDNVNREMSKKDSEASCSSTRRESKRNPLKRKVDVSLEESELQSEERPEKSRRTETDDNVNREMSKKDSEASCSSTRRESKCNPLKRKMMDDLNEEEIPKKRRRKATEEEEMQPTKRIRLFRSEKFNRRYLMEQVVGKGSYAEVIAGIRISDGEKVAVKVAPKRSIEELITLPDDTRKLPLEVALMELVCKPPHSPHVIKLLEWYETATEFILVLERPDPCIDLHTYCKGLGTALPERMVRIIMPQVVLAAIHCHKRGVLHRDIKGGNLLLNPQTLEVKLIDFGCGELLKDTPYSDYKGTRSFCPPEWFLEGEYEAEPATVWGLGILLHNLLCRKPFIEVEEILLGSIIFPGYLSEESCSLMRWCLEHDPKRRPTLEQILAHEWF